MSKLTPSERQRALARTVFASLPMEDARVDAIANLLASEHESGLRTAIAAVCVPCRNGNAAQYDVDFGEWWHDDYRGRGDMACDAGDIHSAIRAMAQEIG